jgi:hypothetical protein
MFKKSEQEFLPVDKDKLKEIISNIIKDFTSGSFSSLIKNLFELRKTALEFDPKEMNLALVDFLMDENMWSWITSGVGKEPTEFDWEAAGYVAADLKTILESGIKAES